MVAMTDMSLPIPAQRIDRFNRYCRVFRFAQLQRQTDRQTDRQTTERQT